MIYILYGSQSGNCESISKMLYECLINETDSITYGTLNSVVNNIESVNGTVYIMCSTFGNGDAPENADAFWRYIKNRKLNNKLFANINYMVLGLGNSNYSHFCDMGKKIDKRLGDLGGKRIKPLVCVDEVGGLEEPVELWLQQIKEK